MTQIQHPVQSREKYLAELINDLSEVLAFRESSDGWYWQFSSIKSEIFSSWETCLISYVVWSQKEIKDFLLGDKEGEHY
jgi:hypothetical protein